MATLTIAYLTETIAVTIDDTVMARVVLAISETYGYQTELPDPTPAGRRERRTIPNPDTTLEFLADHLLQHIGQVTGDREAESAAEQARRQVQRPILERPKRVRGGK